jgi:signal transduction histidine kinase
LGKSFLASEEAAALGLPEGEVYRLIFEDTGCGMDDEVLHRACEPLFTTRPHGPTAGLGLTMVHSVVQLHGGQIAFESPDQDGTRVQIWLPAN